ncbi:MAG: RNA polymerase sigma factor [candidate division Zixibacteria bacterium]|nr:RNA polymerase sigma factor [candidate division Zixibacteria bacterium]
MEKFASGDKKVFSAIMKKFRNKSLNFAYRYLGDFDEAEDATQDCFVKIYFNCHKFDPSRPFEPWFYSVLANCCRDRLRRRNRFADFIERLKLSRSWESSPDTTIDRDYAGLFNKALQRLTPAKREIIALRFTQDMSYQEIAGALGISQGTVMSRLFRAKKDLENILKGMGVSK